MMVYLAMQEFTCDSVKFHVVFNTIYRGFYFIDWEELRLSGICSCAAGACSCFGCADG